MVFPDPVGVKPRGRWETPFGYRDSECTPRKAKSALRKVEEYTKRPKALWRNTEGTPLGALVESEEPLGGTLRDWGEPTDGVQEVP